MPASETQVPFSSHLVPKLAVESLNHLPFSESFVGLLDDDIATSLLFPDPPKIQRKAGVTTDMGCDVEIKSDFAPRFRDGEIEVMGTSPTPRPTHSFRQDMKASDFRLLHILFKDSISSTYLCRKYDDLELYVMQISNKERLRIRAPHEYIQYQREIFHEIRELRSSFLSPFIWSYDDGPEIRYIAEFHPHGSLQDLLDRDTSLSENHTMQLASEIVEALYTLHNAGIIHRELAPCNVMFDASGHIVITGFGQACRPHSAPSFLLRDTSPYCAPELILGWAHDFSVDCWSFGVLMYIMLFGSHPYATKNDNDKVAITQANIHGSLIVPSVSWAAQDLLVNCLERNAALRFDIGKIRAHVYFCTVNWKNVTDRIANPPLVYREDPVGDNVTVSEAQKAVLEQDEPLTLTKEKLVDTFAPMPQRIVKSKFGSLNVHQDAILQTQRRISSQSTRLAIIPEVPDEEESLDEHGIECNTQSRLRQPHAAIDTPGPLSFWDALDLEINSTPSNYSQASTAGREEPRARFGILRKSQSVTFQDRSLSISTASIAPSELRVRNKLRKRMRPASTPTLRSPHFDPLLPIGVKQVGYGIGFSPMEPVASRSTLAYRSAVRACQSLVPVIRRKISGKSLRKQEQRTSTSVDSNLTRDAIVVIRDIYGPTWTFGIESMSAPTTTRTPSATTNDSDGSVTPESIRPSNSQ